MYNPNNDQKLDLLLLKTRRGFVRDSTAAVRYELEYVVGEEEEGDEPFQVYRA